MDNSNISFFDLKFEEFVIIDENLYCIEAYDNDE